jgi:hypothetical protein
MIRRAEKSHGARSELNPVLGLKKWIGGTPLEHPPYSPDLAPCDFWAFPTMKMGLRGKKFRSDERFAAYFSRNGWSVVRNASLAKGGTLKKRPSPHLYKVPTRSNKVSPRTLQTVLVKLITNHNANGFLLSSSIR